MSIVQKSEKVDYYPKYIKYKQKYLNLKNKLLVDRKRKQSNFYFIHVTTSCENLIKILKSGYLYSRGEVKDGTGYGSGFESESKFIYTNIYFDDLKNLNFISGDAIILKPEIVDEFNIIFNKGWIRQPNEKSIRINKDDELPEKDGKWKRIKEYLENPTELPDLITDPKDEMSHEVLFDKKIDLKKYLLAVVYSGCDEKQLESIINELDDYQNVALFEASNFMYDLDEILLLTKN